MTCKGHDLKGKRFGMLLVLELTDARTKSGDRIWLCQCDCGNNYRGISTDIRKGRTYNCGCMRGANFKTHGKSKTRTYRAWADMKVRCTIKGRDNSHLYVDRGITYDKNWEIFENFYANMGPCPDAHSLDRLDPNGNYTKDNCRWASARQQAHNKRNSLIYNYKGKKMHLHDIAAQTPFTYECLYKRLRRGYSLEDAVMGNIQRVKRSGF